MMRSTVLGLLALICAFLLDFSIGDPQGWYHPVRLIGKLIDALQKQLRSAASDNPAKLRRAGVSIVIVTVGATGLVVWLLLALAGAVGTVPRFALSILLDYWLIAARSLQTESMKVYDKLEEQDLPGARHAVSMIVGRDTQNLSEEGVAKAAVETVAENTSDGIIAPLFYLVIGGPVLGWCYKAVNTMDSMIGYKDEKYLHIGRCAAILDDIVNFIPARLAGMIMIAACPIVKLDRKDAWRIFKRDRYNHASPNSAQTEAVMAGALHVQLAGDAWYFGKLYHKKTIGDPLRPVIAEDIMRANRLMYASSTVSLLLFCLVRWLICLI